MSYRGWINLVLGFIIAPVLIISLLNYIIDPFTVFHSNVLKHSFEINERFNKVRHIDAHHEQYDSYILGSSRMGTTSPHILEKHIAGSRFYNFTAAGSTQYDNEMILKYLIKKGYLIKNIYLQVDLTDIYGYEPLVSNYNAKHHPHVSNTHTALFYLSYLSILPVQHIIQKIKVNYLDGHTHYLRYDVANTGRWYADHLEEKIAQDHENYIKNEPSFSMKRLKNPNKGTKIAENIHSLKSIKCLADANNIHLIVFIAPHNHHLMNTLDLQSYLRYLKEISQITDFWDFSGYHSITLDDHYYYENSHYRETVASLIAHRIFNSNELPRPPGDFGSFITNKNITEHLSKREHEATIQEKIMLAMH